MVGRFLLSELGLLKGDVVLVLRMEILLIRGLFLLLFRSLLFLRDPDVILHKEVFQIDRELSFPEKHLR